MSEDSGQIQGKVLSPWQPASSGSPHGPCRAGCHGPLFHLVISHRAFLFLWSLLVLGTGLSPSIRLVSEMRSLAGSSGVGGGWKPEDRVGEREGDGE